MYKMYNELIYFNEFIDLRKKCKKIANDNYKDYIEKIENNICSDSKLFWVYINENRHTREFPKIMRYGDKVGESSLAIANLFSEYFSDIYKSDFIPNCSSNITDKEQKIVCDELSVDEIAESIRKMNKKASMGPDGIPGIFVFNCITTISKPLCKLFNMSLKSSNFPDKWKLSHIIPIYKGKGDKSSIVNYRPITIINAIPKILDCIIADKIYNLSISKISSKQHGSIKGKSTETNLLLYTNYISSVIHKEG